MLFDLQSRRRRTAVKIIYSLLAVLMAGGLVLLGIGTGNGNGGALNAAVNHNGSSGNTSGLNSEGVAVVKAAEKQVAANPNSPSGYAALIQARTEAAGQFYDTSTELFSAPGIAQFRQIIPAWTKYASLIKGPPNATTLTLAVHAYDRTGGYGPATVLWQQYISANPTQTIGYQCLAYTAYAAKKTQLAQEAAAKYLHLTPKIDQLELKDQLAELAKSPSEAGQAAAVEC